MTFHFEQMTSMDTVDPLLNITQELCLVFGIE